MSKHGKEMSAEYRIGSDDGKCNLGERQKRWLKKEVEESTARFTIIGAGITMLPDDRWEEHFFASSREYVKSLRNPNTSKDIFFNFLIIF